MRECPKCSKHISPIYLKTVCKYCGADLMYYNFDERLERDAQKASEQDEKVKRLLNKLHLPGKKR